MKILISVIVFFALLYLAGGVLLNLNQRDLLYFPSPAQGLSFEEVSIASDGARVTAIVLQPDQPRAVIYFGGNAESAEWTAQDFASRQLPHNTSWYFVNYRGYGSSTGEPSEAALFTDARNIYEHLQARHERIAIIGRSLGSGVAMLLAAEYSPDKLILITPYDSIANVAQARFPIYPVHWLLKDHFDSNSRANQVSAATLVMMAETDQVIPREHTIALFETLAESGTPESLASFVLDGENHNTVSEHPLYFDLIRDHLAF